MLLRDIFRKAFGYKIELEIVFHVPASPEELQAFEEAPDGPSKPSLQELHLDVSRGSRSWKTPYNEAIIRTLVVEAKRLASKKPSEYTSNRDIDNWDTMIQEKMYRLLRKYETYMSELNDVIAQLPPDVMDATAKVAVDERFEQIVSGQRQYHRVVSRRNLVCICLYPFPECCTQIILEVLRSHRCCLHYVEGRERTGPIDCLRNMAIHRSTLDTHVSCGDEL